MLVIVTGPPASGKSTLAADLGPRLGLTLLRKDDFKEALFESYGSVPSRRLSDLAWDEVFKRAAALGPVLIEGNLPAERARDVLSLHPSPLEVFCRADPAVLIERLRRRRERHKVHDDEALIAQVRSGVVRGARPLGVGRVIEVWTDRPVDVSSLVVEMQRHIAP